jgi:hypothetical protein
MPWPSDYRIDPTWLNPWPVKYLLPSFKWLPDYVSPDPWQVIGPPSTITDPRSAPLPPPGLPVYWWLLPKETWPYRSEMPWEAKVSGAWPASQVTMAEEPSIWPGKYTTPPWGFIKIRMPGTPDISGDQSPKGNQIAFMNMKIHMRYLSPDEMKVKTAITPLGPRYYFQNKNWTQYEYDYQEFRAVLKELRQKRLREMIAKEVARTKGEPRPTTDLFA